MKGKFAIKPLLPLALVALLLAVPSAQAATGAAPSPRATVSAVEEEFEFEAEGETGEAGQAEEECAEAHQEAAEGEIDQEELEEDCEATSGGAGAGAAICPLRSASAHAATGHDKLKIALGYTTNEPFEATIQIDKGPKQLTSSKRHLGNSGVLRFTEPLGQHRTGKLSLRIHPSNGRAGCPSRRLVLFPK